MTVPCGITATGLPVGLQIVAAKHRDDLVVRVAAAYEAARAADDDRFARPLDARRIVIASEPDTERDDSP